MSVEDNPRQIDIKGDVSIEMRDKIEEDEKEDMEEDEREKWRKVRRRLNEMREIALWFLLLLLKQARLVTGEIQQPQDSTSAEYMAWERSHDIWKDLEERFGYSSIAQVYSLEQKLTEISQGDQSVAEFYTSIKSLWDALDEVHPLPFCTCNNCTCGLTKRIFQRHQEKLLVQFIMKLNEQYASIRGNILMMSPVPKVSEAYRLFA
ncbi:Anthranilate phosphoribosyltransferase [Bienertia sinuspersici]